LGELNCPVVTLTDDIDMDVKNYAPVTGTIQSIQRICIEKILSSMKLTDFEDNIYLKRLINSYK